MHRQTNSERRERPLHFQLGTDRKRRIYSAPSVKRMSVPAKGVTERFAQPTHLQSTAKTWPKYYITNRTNTIRSRTYKTATSQATIARPSPHCPVSRRRRRQLNLYVPSLLIRQPMNSLVHSPDIMVRTVKTISVSPRRIRSTSSVSSKGKAPRKPRQFKLGIPILQGLAEKWGIALDPGNMDFVAMGKLSFSEKRQIRMACHADVIAALPPGDLAMLDNLFPPPHRLNKGTCLRGIRRQLFALHGYANDFSFMGRCLGKHKLFVALYNAPYGTDKAGSLLEYVSV